MHALDGFLDAGNAGALAVRHLLSTDSGRVVAGFDVDEFYDYRARRPPMTFNESRYEDYEAPRLVVRLMRDRRGTPYLLLHGPSRTPAGRASPRQCARWSSTSPCD